MGTNKAQPIVQMNQEDYGYFQSFNKTYNPKKGKKTPYITLPESVKDEVILRFNNSSSAIDSFISAYNCENQRNRRNNCIEVDNAVTVPTLLIEGKTTSTTIGSDGDDSEISDVIGDGEIPVGLVKNEFPAIDSEVIYFIDKADGRKDNIINPDGAQSYLAKLRKTPGSYPTEAYAAKLLTMRALDAAYPILNYGLEHSVHVFTGHAINLDRHEYGFSDQFTVFETQPFGYRLNWTKFNNFHKTPWGVVNPGIDVGLLYSVWNGQEISSSDSESGVLYSVETNKIKQHHRGGVRATAKLEGKLGGPIDGFGTIGIVGAMGISLDIQIGSVRGDVNMYGAITAYGRLGIGWELNKPGTGRRHYITLYTDLIKVGLNPDTNYWTGPLNFNIEGSYAFF